ncbi:hypothetical protein HDK90DRAFT_215213 [Phyllosticta capitalensis]|uniref:Secreted protein n=1 Tax=Phyllosticta capitalensis TaxID=121624 RepID=A0ABR1YTH8_9PEZI
MIHMWCTRLIRIIVLSSSWVCFLDQLGRSLSRARILAFCRLTFSMSNDALIHAVGRCPSCLSRRDAISFIAHVKRHVNYSGPFSTLPRRYLRQLDYSTRSVPGRILLKMVTLSVIFFAVDFNKSPLASS